MKTYKFTKQHVIIAIMFTLMFIGYNAIGQSLKISGKVLFNDKSTMDNDVFISVSLNNIPTNVVQYVHTGTYVKIQ